MGSSFGSTIIYNKNGRPIYDIESKFRNILAQSNESNKALLKAFGMFMGMAGGGAMLYSTDSPWISTVEDSTISGFDVSNIGPHARHYADGFSLPVIVISVFDSDILLLAFCRPTEKPMVFATTHNEMKNESTLLDEYEICEEHMVFPCPFEDYATDDQLREIQKIWQTDEVFIEDIIYKIAKILNFEIVHDNQEPVEGYIYTEV